MHAFLGVLPLQPLFQLFQALPVHAQAVVQHGDRHPAVPGADLDLDGGMARLVPDAVVDAVLNQGLDDQLWHHHRLHGRPHVPDYVELVFVALHLYIQVTPGNIHFLLEWNQLLAGFQGIVEDFRQVFQHLRGRIGALGQGNAPPVYGLQRVHEKMGVDLGLQGHQLHGL